MSMSSQKRKKNLVYGIACEDIEAGEVVVIHKEPKHGDMYIKKARITSKGSPSFLIRLYYRFFGS